MCYACKTSCARNIICVIPYLPYSKQSKMKRRGCIVSKLVAKMLAKSGKIPFQHFCKTFMRNFHSNFNSKKVKFRDQNDRIHLKKHNYSQLDR